MKVVLFCGGQGLRLREYSENIPKPMVPIGYRPIMWHLMKYYAHYGHTEFILCLGYRADAIKEYFLSYKEAVSNDFVLSGGGRDVQLLGSDISNWKITFVDTGMEANIGQRLRAVRKHVDMDEMFLANYADNLTDASLPAMIDHLQNQPDKVASFISVKPSQSFHVVKLGDDGSGTEVADICPAHDCGMMINGGFFVLRREIFDHLRPGEELVIEPFQRLIKSKRLATYRHEGFWACMDTFKEKQTLDDLYSHGKSPWEVWKTPLKEQPLRIVG
jgi:glucose-1-phosphate cytidylyltransferase